MKVFEAWTQMTEMPMSDKDRKQFWKEYLDTEKGFYEQLLSQEEISLQGKVSDLAQSFNVSEEVFAGFLDGINESLEESLDLASLEDTSLLNHKVDLQKLYLNMHRAKAKWLYQLPQWETLLEEETRVSLRKEYQSENIAKKEVTAGRNDPCTCGSGKKYKHCCMKK